MFPPPLGLLAVLAVFSNRLAEFGLDAMNLPLTLVMAHLCRRYSGHQENPAEQYRDCAGLKFFHCKQISLESGAPKFGNTPGRAKLHSRHCLGFLWYRRVLLRSSVIRFSSHKHLATGDCV